MFNSIINKFQNESEIDCVTNGITRHSCTKKSILKTSKYTANSITSRKVSPRIVQIEEEVWDGSKYLSDYSSEACMKTNSNDMNVIKNLELSKIIAKSSRWHSKISELHIRELATS